MTVSGPAGLYFTVLIVIALTLDNGREYGEEDLPLTRKRRETDPVSGCVLSCTAQTYRQLLDRRDIQTVRFHHAATGHLGNHCWSTQIKSGSGERLQNTYVVLPVDMASVLEPSLGLKPTFPHQHDELKAHRGLTVVSENCGLRFDVTGPFASSMARPKFCVKIMPQGNIFVNALKCPPFLVTVWLREHESPT
ncbi:hypothetical protein SKAU_G00357330 [Synaphobranchus kaupii]|uniref:Secreted protein n=1 Tax=Synaphobranchus kaupii TaxID=118154 RepID=A0A9Q1EHN8_SYNKA|nr:hypothetical protein SKAU_G00357330 [Synaphobranchus kaupii]